MPTSGCIRSATICGSSAMVMSRADTAEAATSRKNGIARSE
jgi:hypothetical protein